MYDDRGRSANVVAYRSVAAHGGVAAADPHRLIVMLMDGTLERIAARGVHRGGLAGDQGANDQARDRQLRRAASPASISKQGETIAANLAISTTTASALTRANLEGRGALDEVGHLLRESASAGSGAFVTGGGRGLLWGIADSWAHPAQRCLVQGVIAATTFLVHQRATAGIRRHPAPDGGTAEDAAAIVCRRMRHFRRDCLVHGAAVKESDRPLEALCTKRRYRHSAQCWPARTCCGRLASARPAA